MLRQGTQVEQTRIVHGWATVDIDERRFPSPYDHRAAVLGLEAEPRSRRPLVRAAISIRCPIEILGLRRTTVQVVVEGIAIAVGTRAAVGMVLACRKPRDERAVVFGIKNAVSIVVYVWAAVVILETVVVFRLVDAAISRVGDAVVICV